MKSFLVAQICSVCSETVCLPTNDATVAKTQTSEVLIGHRFDWLCSESTCDWFLGMVPYTVRESGKIVLDDQVSIKVC